MTLKKKLLRVLMLLMGGAMAMNASSLPAMQQQTKQKKVEIQQHPEKKKKPKIQTSARPEDTVYKPDAQNDEKTSSAQRERKNPIARKKRDKSKTIPATKLAKAKPAPKEKAKTRNRYIVLKTNLAYQAVAVSNLAVEVQCTDRISVELPLIWSFWDMEQEHGIRTFALQPEARWWTGSAVGKGHFFGVHAHVAWFNVKWKDNRYQSNDRPLLGAGLSYGYKLPLDEHWGVEFSLGAGYANMRYDTYYNVDNGARIDTRQRHYWGLTRLGLSLVYRF